MNLQELLELGENIANALDSFKDNYKEVAGAVTGSDLQRLEEVYQKVTDRSNAVADLLRETPEDSSGELFQSEDK